MGKRSLAQELQELFRRYDLANSEASGSIHNQQVCVLTRIYAGAFENITQSIDI